MGIMNRAEQRAGAKKAPPPAKAAAPVSMPGGDPNATPDVMAGGGGPGEPDASTTPGGGEQGGSGGAFKAPSVAQFTPPDMKDAVDRVVAAAMRMMYAPQMRQDLQAAIQSQEPVPKRLADNSVGLLLTLDQKTQGGIPVKALFPAAMGVLGEACDVAQAAGVKVTQDDYNNAALMMYVTIGQKLGGKPQDLVGGAAAALSQSGAGGQPGAQPADAAVDAPAVGG